MSRKTLAERKSTKLAELEKIKADLAELERKEAERIGRFAISAGLADLEIDDADLRREFEALASKFRKGDRAAEIKPTEVKISAPAPATPSEN